tara:strand:+ start:89733 stop:90083 length:351 start_codon:yes stop_codon:yes gene_type:complete
MTSNNPYDTPQDVHRSAAPRRLLWSMAIVFGSSIAGGVLGLAIGATLGYFVPGYYRSVFSGGDLPGFDPMAVGIGQGITQGIILGTGVGIILVALQFWFEHRSQTDRSPTSRSSSL